MKLRLTAAQKKLFRDLGRIGGQMSAGQLTPEQRHAKAIKASKAAATARKKKAAARKRAG